MSGNRGQNILNKPAWTEVKLYNTSTLFPIGIEHDLQGWHPARYSRPGIRGRDLGLFLYTTTIQCSGIEKVGIGQKRKNLISIPEATKLTSMFFFGCLHCTGTYLLVFCICVSIYLSNPRVESKKYLVHRNTSFVASGMNALLHPEN